MAEKVKLFGQVADASADHPPYQKGTRCFERIDHIKFGKNQDDIAYVAIEKTVLHVISDAWGTPYGDAAYKGDLVGDSVSQVFSFTKKQKNYTLSALRSFLKTICEVTEEELNDSDKVNGLMLQICGCDEFGEDIGEQPLQNVFVERKDWVKAGKNENGEPIEFVNSKYVRAIKPSEILDIVPEEKLATLFAAGVLEELIKEEQEEVTE